MSREDEYFKSLNKLELWNRYCGYLDFSINQFMEVQAKLLLEQIGLVAGSVLGKKIMSGQKPKTVDEFRQAVPLTRYDDYEPYLSEKRESTGGEACFVVSFIRQGRKVQVDALYDPSS